MNKLSFDASTDLITKIASDFSDYIEMGFDVCPSEQVYKIKHREEDLSIERKARTAALSSVYKDKFIQKVAFDTRRVNQETDRNPRTNLQYWHRADPFIESGDEKKLRVFAKLMRVLSDIKDDFGAEPEWFESYARVLYDNVYRILRIEQGDLDIFKPQLAYLEQLIDARYRLSMEELEKKSMYSLRECILKKDEPLMKRGNYLSKTSLFNRSDDVSEKAPDKMVIDGNQNTTQESIIQAIFGNNGLRRDGEKIVERTISITIRDNVVE